MVLSNQGILFIYFYFFIVVQVQFSAFYPHPSPTPQPSPPPSYNNPPCYCPCVLYNGSCKPFTLFPWNSLPYPLWSLSVLKHALASSVHGVVDEMKIHTDYRSPVEKKGQHGHSLRERAPWPLSQGESALTLALTGFYWLSNSIHQRRFSFIMLRFALGNYFLQITKEWMLLITSYRLTRGKCCKCKGMITVIGLVILCPWEN